MKNKYMKFSGDIQGGLYLIEGGLQMTERAYSEELKKEVSADEAWKLKNQGRLKDRQGFHCFDKECGVRLTFYGWDSPEVSHRFTIQNRDISGHHIRGCMAVGPEEEKTQRKEEIDDIEESISVGKALVLGNTLSRETSSGPRNDDTSVSIEQRDAEVDRVDSSEENKKTQKRHVNELANIVDMFNSPDISNKFFFATRFRMQKKSGAPVKGLVGSRCLEEIFFDMDRGVNPEPNFVHIFYGKAHLKYPEWATKSSQKNIVQVVYDSNSELEILTNRIKLKRVLRGENTVDGLLRSGESFELYFEGFFSGGKTGKPLTSAMYRSLYVQR